MMLSGTRTDPFNPRPASVARRWIFTNQANQRLRIPAFTSIIRMRAQIGTRTGNTPIVLPR